MNTRFLALPIAALLFAAGLLVAPSTTHAACCASGFGYGLGYGGYGAGLAYGLGYGSIGIRVLGPTLGYGLGYAPGIWGAGNYAAGYGPYGGGNYGYGSYAVGPYPSAASLGYALGYQSPYGIQFQPAPIPAPPMPVRQSAASMYFRF